MVQETISHTENKTAGGIFYRITFCKNDKSDAARQTLLLIMGYGGSLHMWPQSMIETLAKKYDLITYDNRGTGRSFLPVTNDDYSTIIMAQDVDEIVATLHLQHFHLLGYSLGGCIALEYARQYPDKLKSLFLLSTTAGGNLYTRAEKGINKALANPEGKTLWDVYLWTFGLMYSPEALEKAIPKLREIYEIAKHTPTRHQALLGHSHAFRNFDLSAAVPQLKMPITILSGTSDRIMPVQNSQALAAQLPDADLVLVPDCQHAVHVEQEPLVINEIEKLINRAR